MHRYLSSASSMRVQDSLPFKGCFLPRFVIKLLSLICTWRVPFTFERPWVTFLIYVLQYDNHMQTRLFILTRSSFKKKRNVLTVFPNHLLYINIFNIIEIYQSVFSSVLWNYNRMLSSFRYIQKVYRVSL